MENVEFRVSDIFPVWKCDSYHSAIPVNTGGVANLQHRQIQSKATISFVWCARSNTFLQHSRQQWDLTKCKCKLWSFPFLWNMSTTSSLWEQKKQAGLDTVCTDSWDNLPLKPQLLYRWYKHICSDSLSFLAEESCPVLGFLSRGGNFNY